MRNDKNISFKEEIVMNLVLETIKKRRSVRRFRPEQITEEEMNALIESALWAPSGHNTQPWHFLIVQDREKIDQMSSATIKKMASSSIDWVRKLAAKDGYHLFHSAPTVVVVSGKQSDDEFLPVIADCSAAIQNMLLAAESLDIGTCWIGLTSFLFEDDEEVASLKIPEGYRPLYTVAVGYKSSEFSPAPPSRKTDTVSRFGR